jgi:hypothetical protein
MTWYKKIKCTLVKCHTNVNSTPPTQLAHTFSYIVAILIHNHFESHNIYNVGSKKKKKKDQVVWYRLLFPLTYGDRQTDKG